MSKHPRIPDIAQLSGVSTATVDRVLNQRAGVRSATVQASAPCKLWSLTAIRFTELSIRQPAIALGLVMAAGAVLAKRLGNRRRRVAAT